MTAEILIGVGLAALGGLCFLLWNTDGSLDILAGVVAVIAFAAAVFIIAWDSALNSASADLPMLRGDLYGAVSDRIRSHRIGDVPVFVLLAVTCFAGILPPIMILSRRARLKP